MNLFTWIYYSQDGRKGRTIITNFISIKVEIDFLKLLVSDGSKKSFNTCSQNRQSTKFQNHENINCVEKLYFFILYNHVYIAKHVVKSLHSGFIFRENTSHYKVGG